MSIQPLKTLALGLAFVVALPALAQDAPRPTLAQGVEGPTFGDWKVQCAATGSCQTYLNIANAETEKLVMTASYHFTNNAAAPTGVVTLPLGIALRAGVKIKLPGEEKAIAMTPEVCFPDGCRVVFNLTAENLSRLLAKDSYQVEYFPYVAPDKRASIAVPTNGLEKAIEFLATNMDVE